MYPQRADIAQRGQVPEAADDRARRAVVLVLVGQNAAFVVLTVQRSRTAVLR